MEMAIGIGIFIVSLSLIEAAYFAFRNLWNPEVKGVRRRLRSFSIPEHENTGIDITRKRRSSEAPWLNRLLFRFGWTEKLDRLMEQSGIQKSLGSFIGLSIILAFVGFLGGSALASNPLTLLACVVFPGMLPFLYIYSKKKQRMNKCERQLPDAMDLIARALRAGHSFASGLRMVADELGDPIGTEFDKALNEINFGVAVPEAMKGLANRIDCPDLKFFVISVIVQRETGGNLAEILENIAHLVRERFKLQGRVRALSAEGRLSAVIMIAIPFVMALVLYLVNPEYLGLLFTDPIGKRMVTFAILMMIVGIVVMKKMIHIRV